MINQIKDELKSILEDLESIDENSDLNQIVSKFQD